MSADDDEPETAASPAALANTVAEEGDIPASDAMIGRYRPGRVLGAGGMGVVFEAVDPELDRRVALKVMRRGGTSDGRLATRLRREAQALARLDHPNVVAVYDVGINGSDLYIVMQIVDGMTLDQYLSSMRPLRAEIIAMFVAAGSGLAAAHAAGIVHRDFKPTNVLVGHDGVVRVSDFGLARETDSSAQPVDTATDLAVDRSVTAGGLVGTPAYMAPEQFEGRAAGPAADQFAFCVALWDALYGERPFAGDTVAELSDSVRAGRRREPRGIRVPKRIRRALERGLAVDPAARFSSMEELLGALQESPRLRRSVVIAGIAVVSAVAAVATLLIRRDQRSPDRPNIDPRPSLLARYRPDTGQLLGGITPDGSTLVYASGTAIWSEDRATGARTQLAAPPAFDIEEVLAAADVVIVEGARSDGQREIWRTGSSGLKRLVSTSTETAFAVRGDGGAIAVSGPDRVTVLSTIDGAALATVPMDSEATAIAFGPEGKLALATRVEGDTAIDIVDTEGARRRAFRGALARLVGITWTSAHSVAVALLTPQSFGMSRASLVDIELETGATTTLYSRDAEAFSDVTATRAGLWFTSRSFDTRIEVARLDGSSLAFAPLGTGGGPDGRVAGWLDDGSLLFATRQGSSMAVARQQPGKPIEILFDTPDQDVPIARDGEALIVFSRGTERCRILRVEKRAQRSLVDEPCSTLLGGVCSGARPPCVVMRRVASGTEFLSLELVTGTLESRYVRAGGPRPLAAMAQISPDGTQLAIAQIGSAPEVVDLATGQAREIAVDRASIQCVAWAPDGDLVVTEGKPTGGAMGRLALDGKFTRWNVPPARWYCDPRVSADGQWVAAWVNDLSPSYWLLEGVR